MKSAKKFFALAFLGTLLSGCVATAPVAEPTERNRLTSGQVQLTLKKNVTTQSEVLEAFGAPNLVTLNSEGEDVWTYQKNATVAKATSSSAYGTIILFGGSSKTAGFEQSSRTMTLIIKFRDKDGVKVVSSFASRASSF